jgi:hypothetical protein
MILTIGMVMTSLTMSACDPVRANDAATFDHGEPDLRRVEEHPADKHTDKQHTHTLKPKSNVRLPDKLHSSTHL